MATTSIPIRSNSSTPRSNFDLEHSLHNVQLQALRGLAACVVMAHHALRVPSSEGWAWQFGTIVLNAHAAVVIFFVLSGYVLTKSLMRRGLTGRSIFTFYVRRGFRIYPALWVGLGLGALYFAFFSTLPGPNLPFWVAGKYDPAGFTATQIAMDVAGLGTYLLGTAWTITVELVASLLLPGIVIALLAGRGATIVLFAALAAVAFIAETALLQVPFYLLQFAIGAALAVLPGLRAWVPSGWMTGVSLLLLVFFKSLLPWDQYAFLITLVEGLSSLVVIAYIGNRTVAPLRRQSLVTIGDWSYSIYLLHLPIAFAFGRLFAQTDLAIEVQALGILAATILITVPLSGLVYRFIELPGIAFGSVLLKQVGLGGRQAVESPPTREN